MTGQRIGYARVSSQSQHLDRQREAFAGLELHKVFEDKASGASTDRPELRECLGYIRQGDVLYVPSIDRLARSLTDLEKIVNEVTGKGAEVRFLKEGLAFGRKDDPCATLLFQVLGAIGQFERSLIRERQAQGISAAKKAGKSFGRPKAMTDAQVARALELIDQGRDKKDVAEELGVSRSTLYRALETKSSTEK